MCCSQEPVDCEQSDWENEGGCSGTCGTGSQKRVRKITKLPNWGGRLCRPVVEFVSCNHELTCECAEEYDIFIPDWATDDNSKGYCKTWWGDHSWGAKEDCNNCAYGTWGQTHCAQLCCSKCGKGDMPTTTTMNPQQDCKTMLDLTPPGQKDTCGSKIKWLQDAQGMIEAMAYAEIKSEYPFTCACKDPPEVNEDTMGCKKKVCWKDGCKGTRTNPVPYGEEWFIAFAAIKGCCAFGLGACDVCCPNMDGNKMGCKRTCYKDKCMGTKTNPIPKGKQWYHYKKIPSAHCCFGANQACDICCPSAPIDCVMTLWKDEYKCSATCGTGKQKQTRTITTYPKMNGQLCGLTTRWVSCNTQPCKDWQCSEVCQDDANMCDWTKEYSCPWAAEDGTKGRATPESSARYHCCCEARSNEDQPCGNEELKRDNHAYCDTFCQGEEDACEWTKHEACPWVPDENDFTIVRAMDDKSRAYYCCCQARTSESEPCGGYKKNVYEKNVAGIGGWGGYCTCPDGQRYGVGDNGDSCGSLACVGGMAGACTKEDNPEWSRNKVTCADAVTYNTPGVGSWGGYCTCPNGEKYGVGDMGDSCGSLACFGGTPSECTKRDNAEWSHKRVVCANFQPNVYEDKAPGVGGWGGYCTCPDGQVYGVGDRGDACGSLACIGGVPGECQRKYSVHWSHKQVTCAYAKNTQKTNVPGTGDYGGTCTCPDGEVLQAAALTPPTTTQSPTALAGDAYSCYSYQEGQDDDWCKKAGSPYVFTGDDPKRPDNYPGCGWCACCKASQAQLEKEANEEPYSCYSYKDGQNDDWCKTAGSPYVYTGDNPQRPDDYPGCGWCACCKEKPPTLAAPYKCQQMYTCYNYADGQDDDWCKSAGYPYAFGGGNPTDYPGCGVCSCCKIAPRKEKNSQNDDTCKAAGFPYIFTDGNNANYPGCGDCSCCKYSYESDCAEGIACYGGKAGTCSKTHDTAYAYKSAYCGSTKEPTNPLLYKKFDYSEEKNEDWCKKTGVPYYYTNGENDNFPGCGSGHCCELDDSDLAKANLLTEIADQTVCTSHADCTNVQSATGEPLGATYCYDAGMFHQGDGYRCAGDATNCCACKENDSFDNDPDKCPAVSDCATICKATYSLVGNGWCLDSAGTRLQRAGGDWQTAFVTSAGSAGLCEHQCDQTSKCVGYMTEDDSKCDIIVSTDSNAIAKADSETRNNCWKINREETVGDSSSDSSDSADGLAMKGAAKSAIEPIVPSVESKTVDFRLVLPVAFIAAACIYFTLIRKEEYKKIPEPKEEI